MNGRLMGRDGNSDLIVLDLANNHQGSVEHGKRIIDALARAPEYHHRAEYAIKFQFRDLDTFIRPDASRISNKHVDRFRHTKLSWDQFYELKEFASEAGFLTMCTPFDEVSVAKIQKMDFDLVKLASCSATDWPLVEAVAEISQNKIVSTGGRTLEEVDKLVSFFSHRVDNDGFALMHCVSIYPSPNDALNLNNITRFRNRYPLVRIGWSTHEEPDNLVPVIYAKALGASIFERHVGLPSAEITLNGYSSAPEQVFSWLTALKTADEVGGCFDRSYITNNERDSLRDLERGIFVKRDAARGNCLAKNDVFFAFPREATQLSAGDFHEKMVISRPLSKDTPVLDDDVDPSCLKGTFENPLKLAAHGVKGMLSEANVQLGHDFKVEFSHHYGISRFKEIGVTIITLINRGYCKKILVQLPGQDHPKHFHKRKEETFYVVSGELHAVLDGNTSILMPGEQVTISPGTWHSFSSPRGCIFEEISTTHFNDDSFYSDLEIRNLARDDRKTIVDLWGRFD